MKDFLQDLIQNTHGLGIVERGAAPPKGKQP